MGGLVLVGLWEQRDSNPRPSACKADALNQLSYAPEWECKSSGNFGISKNILNFAYLYCVFWRNNKHLLS